MSRATMKVSGLMSSGVVREPAKPVAPGALHEAVAPTPAQPTPAQPTPAEPSAPPTLPQKPPVQEAPIVAEPLPDGLQGKAIPLIDIPLTLLDDSGNQNRGAMNETDLNELAASIKEVGVTQPISVRRLPTGRYEIVAGHRRVKASGLARQPTIPAYVHTYDDQQAMVVTLTENEKRIDLTDYERAVGMQKLSAAGKSQTQIGNIYGIKQPMVSMHLQMLQLPEALLAIVLANPKSIGVRAAAEAAQLAKEHPEHEKVIERALTAVSDGRMKQKDLKHWVESKIKPADNRPQIVKAQVKQVSALDGTPLYTTEWKPGEKHLVIKWVPDDVNIDELDQAVRAALEKLRG